MSNCSSDESPDSCCNKSIRRLKGGSHASVGFSNQRRNNKAYTLKQTLALLSGLQATKRCPATETMAHIEVGVKVREGALLGGKEVEQAAVQARFAQQRYQVLHRLRRQVVLEEGRHPLRRQGCFSSCQPVQSASSWTACALTWGGGRFAFGGWSACNTMIIPSHHLKDSVSFAVFNKQRGWDWDIQLEVGYYCWVAL